MTPVAIFTAPRPAVQPTAQTDRQHLARLAQADRWAVLHRPESPVAQTVPLWRVRAAAGLRGR